MIQVTASDCNCFLAGGIISAPHVLKIVGAVGDGPANTIGIGHKRHFQCALLVPLVLNRMAVGEGQNAELPVPLAALR